MDGILDAIIGRRSIRKYKTQKHITKDILEKIIYAAMLAPSACNTRPWEFIAITNREMLNTIAEIHPYAKMCANADAAIVIVALPQGESLPSGFYPQDCGAATQNILLQAQYMGLGTCWCGVYPKEEKVAEMRQLLKVETPKIPFNIIALGVPDENPPQRGFFEAEKIRYIE